MVEGAEVETAGRRRRVGRLDGVFAGVPAGRDGPGVLQGVPFSVAVLFPVAVPVCEPFDAPFLKAMGCSNVQASVRVFWSILDRLTHRPFSSEPRGTPSRKTTILPKVAGTRSPGVTIPTRFRGSQADTATN